MVSFLWIVGVFVAGFVVGFVVGQDTGAGNARQRRIMLRELDR